MTEANRSAPGDKSDTRYFITAGILMVVIIATLAALWLIERRRRIGAETNLVRVNLKYSGLRAAMENPLFGLREPSVTPVQREDLPAETADYKGRPRMVLYLSAAAAERFGFNAGDLIDVADWPTTQQQ